MDDSSEDDRPIGTRDIVKAATRLLEDDDSDASGSPMPEWISQHTPVEKSRPELQSSSDSDDVVDLISQDPKDTSQNVAKQKAAPTTAAAVEPKKLGGTYAYWHIHSQVSRLSMQSHCCAACIIRHA